MSTPATIAVLSPGSTRLELAAVELSPGPHEVVVEQFAVGVCHSQLDQIDAPGRFGAPADGAPVVMGHESVGRVVDVGEAVTGFRPGDEVLVTWIPRTKELDRLPEPSRVPLADGRVAVTHNVFAWGTHTMVDELYVCRAPDGTPKDVGCIIGCAVMTGAGAVMHSAKVKAGESVVVWGAGGVGLAAVAAAAIAGADPVIAVDMTEAKLDRAREFGATHTVNASEGDPATAILELTASRHVAGADHVIDCIGRVATVQGGLRAVRPSHVTQRPGGQVVLAGVPVEPLVLDGLDLVANEKQLIGCKAGDSVPEEDFPELVEWHTQGRLDLNQLVSRRYRLDQVNEAVDELRAGRIVGRAIIEL